MFLLFACLYMRQLNIGDNQGYNFSYGGGNSSYGGQGRYGTPAMGVGGGGGYGSLARDNSGVGVRRR